MRRIICLILAIALVAGMLCACGKTKETPAEDFEYVIENGEVYITGYRGTDREIVIPETIEKRPVTRIEGVAFKGYDLTSVVISENVQVIARGAFEECVCLEKVTIAEGLTVIESFAFAECEALASVELPNSLELLEGFAFSGCDSLYEVIVPDEFTGFEINSLMDTANSSIGNGNYYVTYIDVLSNPINDCGNAVLVVAQDSQAQQLIEQYGQGEIPYKTK